MKQFDNITALSQAFLNNSQIVGTKGAKTSTDRRTTRYLVDTAPTGIALASGNFAVPLSTDKAVDPLSYGCMGDGATDDTANLQNCLNNSSCVIIDGVDIAVTQITVPENCYVDCINGGRIVSVGSIDDRMVTLLARSTGHLAVNANNLAVNTIYTPPSVTYDMYIKSIDYADIRMDDLASPIIAGYSCFSLGRVWIGTINGRNLDQNNYTNRSFPQGLVTGAGIYIIGEHYLEDGAAGFVPTGRTTESTPIQDAPGRAYILKNHSVRCTDNSAYLLGGYVAIGENICSQGVEESVQINAVQGADIGRIVCEGRCLGAFNIQNTLGPVNIGEVVGAPESMTDFDDYADKVPTSIAYTRPGNTSLGSKDLTIGSVRGYFQRGFLMDQGEIESMTVANVDCVLCYKPSTNPVNQWVDPTTIWWTFTACKRVLRRDIRVQIRNFEVTPFPIFTSGDNFATTNRPNTDFGVIENEEFYLIENDGTETDNNHVRSEAPQDNLHQEGQYYRNIGGTCFSVNPRYANYQRESINGDFPQSGYWYAGKRLQNRDYTGDVDQAKEWCCEVTGTSVSSNWIPFGRAVTGAGDPNGVVTVEYIGQSYRDTATGNFWQGANRGTTVWGR